MPLPKIEIEMTSPTSWASVMRYSNRFGESISANDVVELTEEDINMHSLSLSPQMTANSEPVEEYKEFASDEVMIAIADDSDVEEPQLIDIDLNTPVQQLDSSREEKVEYLADVSISAKMLDQVQVLNRLLAAINKLDNINLKPKNIALTNFISQLTILHAAVFKQLTDDNNGLSKNNSVSNSDVAVQFANQALIMLDQLDLGSANKKVKSQQLLIIEQYEEKCRQIYNDCYHTAKSPSVLKEIGKMVAAVIITAVGFILGAAIGASIGILAGAWSGFGAVATSLVGLVHGAITGASLGLTLAAGVTGIAAGSFAAYSLFKPARLNVQDSNFVVNPRLLYASR